MNLHSLPNFPVVRSLYNRYHGSSEAESWDSSPHVSSHWKIYGNQSRINIDADGNLVDIYGMGFGKYEHERFLKRMVDYVICGIHFLLAAPKRELFHLTRKASLIVKKLPLGKHYISYDLFRQIHALATIKEYIHLSQANTNKFTVVVIGDGFGFLSALLKRVYPHAQILLVDIGRTLLYQCLYLQLLFPNNKHTLISKDSEWKSLTSNDFVFCPAEELGQLRDFQFNLAVNICSMQEMTFSEVERYFAFLRSHAEKGSLFYCCNRECKVLPDGEKIEFLSYPWLQTDQHLIDGYPSVYKFWFAKKSNGRGPKVCGIRIPFLEGPDGPIRHRLTILAK